jgi:hypothetical protein
MGEGLILSYKECKEILASEFVVWGATEDEYADIIIPLLRSQIAKVEKSHMGENKPIIAKDGTKYRNIPKYTILARGVDK